MAEEYVIMPKADYIAACDAVRKKTGKSDPIKSGDLGAEIESVEAGSSGGADSIPPVSDTTFGNDTEIEILPAVEGKLYYDNELLPELPVVEGYPYMLLEKLANRYYLVCSSKKYYYASSNAYYLAPSGTSAKNYAITFDEYAEGGTWILKSTTAYSQAGPVFWANYDIPLDSASSTTIHFHATEPTEEGTKENLVPAERADSYIVNSDDLNTIAGLVQSIAGTKSLLSIADIIALLTSIGEEG